MSNFYEILVIASPDETDEGVDAVIGGLRQQITTSGGEVIDVSKWGRRKLAYPIGKHTEGVYLLIHAEGPAALPGEFRAYTKIRESILREMPVRLDALQEADARQAISERGPEDEGLAEAQIEAAAQSAAAKRAEIETSVSDRDDEEESDVGGIVGDEVAAVDEAAPAYEADAADEVAPDDEVASADEAISVDDDSASDDSDENAAGAAPSADDSSDGDAEGEPRVED